MELSVLEMTRILPTLAIATSALVGVQQALAGPSDYAPAVPSAPPAIYEAGTVMVRVGISYVDPDDDTGKRRYDRNLYPFFDGLRYDMDSDTTWNFTLGFMPVDHFSVEIGYIGKSGHDLDLTGLLGSFVNEFKVDRIRAGSIDRRHQCGENGN